MKQYFIQKKNHCRLVLFFAGWGMDEHPFLDYRPEDSDLLLCYDYRSPKFDFSLLKGYRRIRLIGWSMGVRAAPEALQQADLPIEESIAVNGTMTPVDNEKGIPEVIFQGTLEGLDERNLLKFRRRMCGGSEALKAFLEKAPQRGVEELREELCRIGERATALPPPAFRWEKAIVGKADLIFTPGCQQNAWRDTGTECVYLDMSHYSEEILRRLLLAEGMNQRGI